MAKNIVICCDGTTNEVSTDSTNVLRLYRTLIRDTDQLAYYDAGVGTVADSAAITVEGKRVSKELDSATGHSVRENAVKAYRFLASHYVPGDKIFLFGFSRGAYTVKAVAGMIHFLGLVRPELEGLAPLGWALYSDDDQSLAISKRFGGGARFKKCFSVESDTRIHFIGLWDTVSSFGWFWDFRALPYTADNASLDHIRHALAIDERRVAFRTNQFRPRDPTQHLSLKQVWFAGAHCDVGGGYPELDDALAKIAFAWMEREAELYGLLIDTVERNRILTGAHQSHPNPLGTLHESLQGRWQMAELLPRRVFNPDTQIRQWSWPNLGSRRKIPEDALLHESVVTRLNDTDANYHPGNLPTRYLVEH
jgi:uncharacterized protein (DUF2235 family)